MFELAHYKTRAGLLVNLNEYTPKRSFKMVGYHETKGVRIRVFYKENGDEYFGEKGLDLMERIPHGDAFIIRSFDPKEARKQVMGEKVP